MHGFMVVCITDGISISLLPHIFRGLGQTTSVCYIFQLFAKGFIDVIIALSYG